MPEVEPVTSAVLPLSMVVLLLSVANNKQLKVASYAELSGRRTLPLFLLQRNIYVGEFELQRRTG
jgi:hypothetical protein